MGRPRVPSEYTCVNTIISSMLFTVWVCSYRPICCNKRLSNYTRLPSTVCLAYLGSVTESYNCCAHVAALISCRSKPQKLATEVYRSTYTQASVRCSQYSPRPDCWLVAVTKDQYNGSNSSWYFVVDGDAEMQLDISLNFLAGHKYKVIVKALAASKSDAANSMSCHRVIAESVTHFRAGACACFLSISMMVELRDCLLV